MEKLMPEKYRKGALRVLKRTLAILRKKEFIRNRQAILVDRDGNGHCTPDPYEWDWKVFRTAKAVNVSGALWLAYGYRYACSERLNLAYWYAAFALWYFRPGKGMRCGFLREWFNTADGIREFERKGLRHSPDIIYGALAHWNHAHVKAKRTAVRWVWNTIRALEKQTA
jgi:hypothetical protein